MFNKIQNHLLLRHPLLWNIKIVPMLAITLIIHALFFITGYAKGTINFKQKGWQYNLDNDSPTVVFFSILLSLVILILWLVYYFRNNAYKSFYPKKNASLYKEWLLILVISILNCSYTATFFYAQDVRKTSYFDNQETQYRIDIISMASLFTDERELVNNDGHSQIQVELAQNVDEKNGKKRSLLTYSVHRFGSYSYRYNRDNSLKNRDSVNNARVKGWLRNNQRDSVEWLFTQFEKIAKSHDLKSNITPQQWVNLVYKYPEFNEYELIASTNRIDNNYENYTYATTETSTSDYYVPMKEMTYSYEKIHNAEYKPFITTEIGLIYLCVAFGLSLTIFSFRVTSGRGWLIALVSVGITAMITGLFSVVTGAGESYPIMWLLIIVGLLIYYLAIASSRAGKGLTDIILNALIWLLAWVIPIIASIIVITRVSHNNYNGEYNETFSHWIENNIVVIMYVNLAIILVYMYLLTASIKKWRGIAEA
ncbi:MAG: hypothetical protein V4581_05310 [Bacteroidota bacterium]